MMKQSFLPGEGEGTGSSAAYSAYANPLVPAARVVLGDEPRMPPPALEHHDTAGGAMQMQSMQDLDAHTAPPGPRSPFAQVNGQVRTTRNHMEP